MLLFKYIKIFVKKWQAKTKLLFSNKPSRNMMPTRQSLFVADIGRYSKKNKTIRLLKDCASKLGDDFAEKQKN